MNDSRKICICGKPGPYMLPARDADAPTTTMGTPLCENCLNDLLNWFPAPQRRLGIREVTGLGPRRRRQRPSHNVFNIS